MKGHPLHEYEPGPLDPAFLKVSNENRKGKIMNKNNLTGLLSRRSRAGVMASGLLGAHLALVVWACAGVGLAAPERENRIRAGEPGDHSRDDRRGHRSEDRIIFGETTEIAGGMASTWARVNGAGKVIWVGLTIPLSMVEQMPPRGSGPSGAVAVLSFPQVVQETTYFNHAEIHANPLGHPSSGADLHRYQVPHFDFHFYSIPVEDVFAIPGGLFFVDVPEELLPDGYAQPEPVSIPQMGRHGSSFEERATIGPFDFATIAGFLPDASYMHFLEPMMSQEFLLRRESFDLPVPIPSVLGRSTRYPTECVVRYDEDADAYHIVFKGFPPIE